MAALGLIVWIAPELSAAAGPAIDIEIESERPVAPLQPFSAEHEQAAPEPHTAFGKRRVERAARLPVAPSPLALSPRPWHVLEDLSTGGSTQADLSGAPAQDDIRRLIVPSLQIDAEVVYLPFSENTWDVADLGQSVGWLGEPQGSAELGSNVVLAGHITVRNADSGPFRYLHRLQPGAIAIVHTSENIYTYQVREQVVVEVTDFHITESTAKPQLTLLTCTTWDEKIEQYRQRRAVFADLLTVRSFEEARHK